VPLFRASFAATYPSPTSAPTPAAPRAAASFAKHCTRGRQRPRSGRRERLCARAGRALRWDESRRMAARIAEHLGTLRFALRKP